jgi:hypothetical protein
MKNFINYLEQSQKTYEFRIKIADVDPNEKMDRIEGALEAYCLESISKPRRLPIQESDIDFPAMKNCQIYLLDAVVKYPCNNDQVRAVIAERAGIPAASVFVVPKNHPEELWRWNESGDSDLREFKQGEAVLDKPYEDSSAAKAAGDAYANFNSILKELNQVKLEEAEGGKTPEAKTTNDLPTSDTSPVGSKQNTIPSAVKGKK